MGKHFEVMTPSWSFTFKVRCDPILQAWAVVESLPGAPDHLVTTWWKSWEVTSKTLESIQYLNKCWTNPRFGDEFGTNWFSMFHNYPLMEDCLNVATHKFEDISGDPTDAELKLRHLKTQNIFMFKSCKKSRLWQTHKKVGQYISPIRNFTFHSRRSTRERASAPSDPCHV